MSFWDDITGGGPKQVSTLNPDQAAVSTPLAGYFDKTLAGGPNQYLYGGQLTAPITTGEQQGVDQSSRLAALTGNTVNQLGNYDPNQINSDFNKYVQAPSMSNWQNNIAPYLREQLNGFSSEQGNVLSRSLLTNQNNLDQMRMGYLQQGKDTALNALGVGNTVNATNQNIQAVPREIQQAGLTAGYNNFLQANQTYQNSVNQMLNYLGIQTNALVQQPNPLAIITGGAQAGAQTYSAVQNANANNTNANTMSQYAQLAALAGV